LDFDERPTMKSIEKSHPSGAYVLECDGRHDVPRHVYYFYTKKEVLSLWFREHPLKEVVRTDK
jgi:hypothetical protein